MSFIRPFSIVFGPLCHSYGFSGDVTWFGVRDGDWLGRDDGRMRAFAGAVVGLTASVAGERGISTGTRSVLRSDSERKCLTIGHLGHSIFRISIPCK